MSDIDVPKHIIEHEILGTPKKGHTHNKIVNSDGNWGICVCNDDSNIQVGNPTNEAYFTLDVAGAIRAKGGNQYYMGGIGSSDYKFNWGYERIVSNDWFTMYSNVSGTKVFACNDIGDGTFKKSITTGSIIGSFFKINTGSYMNAILDEDDMTSNSAIALATQQSIKAYVDSKTSGIVIGSGNENNVAYFSAGSSINGNNQFTYFLDNSLRLGPYQLSGGGIVSSADSGTKFPLKGDVFSSYHSNDTNYPTFTLVKGRGTTSSPTFVQSGDYLGTLFYTGYASGGTYKFGAAITSRASQDWNISGALGTDLIFSVRKNSMGEDSSKLMKFSSKGVYVMDKFIVSGLSNVSEDGIVYLFRTIPNLQAEDNSDSLIGLWNNVTFTDNGKSGLSYYGNLNSTALDEQFYSHVGLNTNNGSNASCVSSVSSNSTAGFFEATSSKHISGVNQIKLRADNSSSALRIIEENYASPINFEVGDITRAVINRSGLSISGGLVLENTVKVNSILDEDDMASDSNTALATQQSIKAYVDNNATLTGLIWDTIVDAGSSGNYISIATACGSMGANKSIFVKRGTYSEADDIVPADGQRIYFDNVAVSFSTGKHFNCITSGTNLTLEGYVDLQGDGASCRLMDIRVNNVNGKNCRIKVTPTANENLVADTRNIYLTGSYHNLNFIGQNITHTPTVATQQYQFCSVDCAQSKIKVELDGANMVGISGATLATGVTISNDFNTVEATINNVITNTGNTGKGINIIAGGDYNCVYGSSRGCDSANLADAGTGNKTASVAT